PCAFPRDLNVLCGCLCSCRQHKKNGVKQIVDTTSMLSRNRKHIPHPEHMKLVKQSILPIRVHLVDGKKERLASARQKSSQLAIGPRNLSASIDHHDDRRRFVERDPGLPKDFRRYEVFVVRNDTARIHGTKFVPAPFDLAIKPVTRDARLVSDDGTPRSRQMIEQRRFPDVRASDNRNEWGGFLFAQSD